MRKYPGEIFWSRSGKEGRLNLKDLTGLTLNRYTFAHIWLLSQTGQFCILSSEKILRFDEEGKKSTRISPPEVLFLQPKFSLDDSGEHLIVSGFRRFGPAAEQDVLLAVDILSGKTTQIPLRDDSIVSSKLQSLGNGRFIATFKNFPLTTGEPTRIVSKPTPGWYFLSIVFQPSGEVETRLLDQRANMPETLGLLSNRAIGFDGYSSTECQLLYANQTFRLNGRLSRYGITDSALWVGDSKRNYFRLKANGIFDQLTSYGDLEIIGHGTYDDSFWIVLADGTLDEFGETQKRSHLALPGLAK
jgi:hypothetical protein